MNATTKNDSRFSTEHNIVQTQTNEERAAGIWQYYTSVYGFNLGIWPYKIAVTFCDLMGTKYPER